VKAIETVYNGYRFRSRLEARWAVFFDILGIEYQYEVEGYDIDGVWYLPDFWLPGQQAWVEIKPMLSDYESLDFSKPKALSIAQENFVYVYEGEPYPKRFSCWIFLGGNIEISDYLIFKSLDFKPPEFFRFMHEHCSQEFFNENFDNVDSMTAKSPMACKFFDNVGGNPEILKSYQMQLDKAYTAARQARFEHLAG
jgi:hypothetical protein